LRFKKLSIPADTFKFYVGSTPASGVLYKSGLRVEGSGFGNGLRARILGRFEG